MRPKPPPGVQAVRGPGGRIDIVARSSKTGPQIQKHLAEQARRYAGLLQFMDEARSIMGFAPSVSTKEGLIRLGQFFWQHTYKKSDDDGEAADRYDAFLADKPKCFQETSMQFPDILLNIMSARWFDQGLPVVTMGEKYFAAIVATQIPQEMLEEIEAPWKAFVIEVPAGLLFLYDPDEQKRVRITRILVHRFYPGLPETGDKWAWRWIVLTETGQHIWRHGTAEQLLSSVKLREGDIQQYVNPEIEGDAFSDEVAQDERLFTLIGRLVLNVCLAMSDPTNVREMGSSHKRYAQAKERGDRTGPPEQRVFQLGRPIEIDCRPALEEYLGGKREAHELKVQFLVRGHWRNQAHGPKHTLRRRQWIEPFWKGPADAPINVRPHKIGPSDNSD